MTFLDNFPVLKLEFFKMKNILMGYGDNGVINISFSINDIVQEFVEKNKNYRNDKQDRLYYVQRVSNDN